MKTTFTGITETSFVRKTALGVASLAFVGGAVAGPVGHAFASPAEHAAPAMTTVAAVTSDKPGMDKLIPHGTQGAQSSIDLSKEQTDNAKAITETAKKLGMGERGAVIAVATSMQESKLENLGHLGDMNDHDSLGLFQQRPSSGWGTPEQITDPTYASTAFLSNLKQVDGWQDMPLTDAAQKVQVSAFPDAYAQWENQAAHIVQDVWTK
ncbi:hypothetical protein [Micromonospora sp. NBC_01796]|uniref:hypothetical protein n=1 Tax=Micromonospora sp. NBC_01796 TaxID=2975987 RepID=UPI002DDB9FF4|nr:hypothetical protein [Micromonospora sp. NBC_01796]WSA89621.1 hypothetical protein OIE47_19515 [Micromonospora sp. NBC_01796]